MKSPQELAAALLVPFETPLVAVDEQLGFVEPPALGLPPGLSLLPQQLAADKGAVPAFFPPLVGKLGEKQPLPLVVLLEEPLIERLEAVGLVQPPVERLVAVALAQLQVERLVAAGLVQPPVGRLVAVGLAGQPPVERLVTVGLEQLRVERSEERVIVDLGKQAAVVLHKEPSAVEEQAVVVLHKGPSAVGPSTRQ